MVRDDRRGAHRITDVDRHKEEGDVLDDTVGGNAVFPDVSHQLTVIEHVDEGHGDVRHELGEAVPAGLPEGGAVPAGPAEAVKARVREAEIEQRDETADTFTDRRRPGGTGHAPSERAHEEVVEHHVGDAGRHGHPEAEARFLRRHQERLEHVLEQERDNADEHDAPVLHAVREHGVAGAEQTADRGNGQFAKQSQEQTDGDAGVDEQAERAVRFLLIALPHLIRDQSRSADAEDKTDAAEDHDVRPHEVQCREGGRTGEVRDKDAVDDTVEACEDHHHDRR